MFIRVALLQANKNRSAQDSNNEIRLMCWAERLW